MTQGDSLFDIWGGVRRMARDLMRPASTVHGWKKEGRIPANEQPRVLEVGKSLGLAVTAEHVVFPLGRSHPESLSALGEQPHAVCFDRTGGMKPEEAA